MGWRGEGPSTTLCRASFHAGRAENKKIVCLVYESMRTAYLVRGMTRKEQGVFVVKLPRCQQPS